MPPFCIYIFEVATKRIIGIICSHPFQLSPNQAIIDTLRSHWDRILPFGGQHRAPWAHHLSVDWMKIEDFPQPSSSAQFSFHIPQTPFHQCQDGLNSILPSGRSIWLLPSPKLQTLQEFLAIWEKHYQKQGDRGNAIRKRLQGKWGGSYYPLRILEKRKGLDLREHKKEDSISLEVWTIPENARETTHHTVLLSNPVLQCTWYEIGNDKCSSYLPEIFTL